MPYSFLPYPPRQRSDRNMLPTLCSDEAPGSRRHGAVIVVPRLRYSVMGSYEGRPLLFTYDQARGVAWALTGAVAFEEYGAPTR